MTIQTMTTINLAMLSATVIITLLFGGIAAFLPTIINAIDERRYNATTVSPISLVRSRRARLTCTIRKRQERKDGNTHIAERIGHGKSYNRPTYLSLDRAAAEASLAKLPRPKRFNAPKRSKIKRSTQNPTTTINHQPIASPAAPKEVIDRAIIKILTAFNAEAAYHYWKESTDDLGYNAEIYNAYKSRKAVLAAA